MRVPATLGVVVCLIAEAACQPGGGAAHAAPAAPTQEQAQAAQAFMLGVMEPAAEEVWNSVGFIVDASGEHDLSPQNDAEWAEVVADVDAVERLAEGLKNAAFAWDPATWSGYCDGVIAAAEANRRAAEAHDGEAMYAAGEQLDAACESCHLHFEEGESAGLAPL